MTEILELNKLMRECPKCWQNFIKDIGKRNAPDNGKGFKQETLNQELMKFKAKYVRVDEQRHVDFSNASYYTLFVTKYG